LPAQVEVLVLCVVDVWAAAQIAARAAYGPDAAPLTEAQARSLEDAERAELKMARATAMDACKSLKEDHPEWTVWPESGADAPAFRVIRRAEEWGADLIVIGSHGRSALGRLVAGSVSQAVVRDAPCTTRVVHGASRESRAPACLIIGFDGSPDAEAAVAAVAGRTWPGASTARLVTAIDGAWPGLAPAFRRIGQRRHSDSTWLRRIIEDPMERLRAAGLFVTPVAKLGDPRIVLIDEARRWDADGLFVGARGLRGIKRLLLGSVSMAAAMQAPCPVEVARPARAGAAEPSFRVRAGQATGSLRHGADAL
jgi:nucleotide-binding universal stress UspA family protein